jgi:DNA-binding GntR family transcriptional regulator
MNTPLMQVQTVAAPVRQQVFDAIREAIVTAQFRPGQRLVEKDLCEMLGVSRPSVREALRQLESEGLIQTIPNRGPVVAKLSRSEAISIYQVRGALEALAARLFVENAGKKSLQDLEAAFGDLKKAVEAGDVQQALAIKDRFYAVLFEGAGNSIITGILRTMNARITFMRRVSLSSPQRWPAMLKEMRAVLTAIKAGDGEAAHAASLLHVQKAAEVAVARLDDDA